MVFPPVVQNLLIITGLAYMTQFVADDMFLHWFALWPIGDGFRPWQLVSYAFLHGGFYHLLFNMFALWMFGRQIETTWGSRRFAVYYFVCVVGAGLTQIVLDPGAPIIGASGGVFGILAAFGMLFPEQRIMLLFPPIPMKAKYFVIGYGIIELWFVTTGGQAGVANLAHLGGMVVGILLILYWRGRLPIKPHRSTPYY